MFQALQLYLKGKFHGWHVFARLPTDGRLPVPAQRVRWSPPRWQVHLQSIGVKHWMSSAVSGQSSDHATGEEVTARRFHCWMEAILSKARAEFRHIDSPLSEPFPYSPSRLDQKPDWMQFLHRAMPAVTVQTVARFEWRLLLDLQGWKES